MVEGLGPHFLLTNINKIKRWNFWLQRSNISSKCFVKVILSSKVIPWNFIWGEYESTSPYKDKAGSALIAVWDLENIMTLVFSGGRPLFSLLYICIESYGAGLRPRRHFVLLLLTFMLGRKEQKQTNKQKKTKRWWYLNSSYFQLKMISNLLNQYLLFNQKLLMAESSAGTLLWYRCRYSRQFIKFTGRHPYSTLIF